jgi:hypothetical protein
MNLLKATTSKIGLAAGGVPPVGAPAAGGTDNMHSV